MDVKYIGYILKKIKFGLVFFCGILLLIQCNKGDGINNFKVVYQADKAIAIRFESRIQLFKVEFFNAGEDTTAILGDLQISENQYVFHPVIPFAKGAQYHLKGDGQVLKMFTIDAGDTLAPGELKVIYPSRDTVPENLLKIYLQFDQPMQEVGSALDYITVIDQGTEEVVEVFLELESELWNKAHDRLTLWLDPGRIKTDLIPNQKMGLPLTAGHEYTLHISSKWHTAQGMPLKKDYKKQLVVTTRDSSMPNLEGWEIQTPTATQKGALEINFGEPLDAILLLETLVIEDAHGQMVPGDFVLGKHEKSILFNPVNDWNKRNYKILIEAKLEDLAGNNLNRLFDTDITQTTKISDTVSSHYRNFIIH